jgi:pimeloyl-ACP methyl ester carboxylesterase
VVVAAAVLLLAVLAGRDGADDTPAGGPDTFDGRCVVRLHGKGGDPRPSEVRNGVAYLNPGGNGRGWGGREWRYFPDDAYDEARAVVTGAVDDQGCERVVVHGFSNGGAFAAKLYCRGEDLDGRLVGVVIDDPVPDHGVADCDPSGDVTVTLYWTGELDRLARPGWDCAEEDWTCEGGTTIGIAAYASELDTPAKPSRHAEHLPYLDAPEVTAFG